MPEQETVAGLKLVLFLQVAYSAVSRGQITVDKALCLPLIVRVSTCL